ncbi:MAG: hypothetical protein E5X65_25700 [Mesorhizobium sp.]|nr:MAG: hypothetical protein E5X65_25700 [Mesorhizobium sp.]
MFRVSFRRFLDRLSGEAGPGLGGDGTGHDAAVCGNGIEIVKVEGGGPLRLRDRFSRERAMLAARKED